MNNIRQLLIMICLCLAAATHSQAKSSAEKACITGTVCTINNAPFANVPVCLEVITSKLAENGSVRAMTDSLGRFSINWKDLSRKKSLQPAYTLYINYLRDYMRIDANECLAYPCVTKKGKGAAGDFFIDPDGTVDLKARLGQYVWVKAEKAVARNKPSGAADEIGEVVRPAKLVMIDQSGEWLQVKIATHDLMGEPQYDKTGWVSRSTITEQYLPPVSPKQRQRESLLEQHHTWPANFVTLIKQGQIAKGMTKDMVKASLGDPAKIAADDKDKKGNAIKWEYIGEAIKSVVFKNDQVQSWE